MFDVEVGDKTFDEMHVDGGTVTEVFFYGHMINIENALHALGVADKPKTRIYIIRNNQLRVPYKATEIKLLPIGERALDSLTSMQGVGDLYRIYVLAKRDAIDFNLTYIPDDFVSKAKEPFDPVETKRLYKIGYRKARSGDFWMKFPPGLEKKSST